MNKYNDVKAVERSNAVLKKLERLPKVTRLNCCCIYVRHARRAGVEVDDDMKARLIERALMDREPEAYALLILMKLDEKAYSEAKRLAQDLTACDWKELAEEWGLDWVVGKSFDFWVGKNMDAAIICCLAACFTQSVLPEADREEMEEMIRNKRPELLKFLDGLRKE